MTDPIEKYAKRKNYIGNEEQTSKGKSSYCSARQHDPASLGILFRIYLFPACRPDLDWRL
jgi:hypothetical protein